MIEGCAMLYSIYLCYWHATGMRQREEVRECQLRDESGCDTHQDVIRGD